MRSDELTDADLRKRIHALARLRNHLHERGDDPAAIEASIARLGARRGSRD